LTWHLPSCRNGGFDFAKVLGTVVTKSKDSEASRSSGPFALKEQLPQTSVTLAKGASDRDELLGEFVKDFAFCSENS